MTPFAKMLVFLNLALSMIFTVWSIGLYSGRVDWAPGKTLGGDKIEDRPGRLANLKKEIEDYTGRRDLAERRWQIAWPDVIKEEKHRSDNKAWYDNMEAATRTGKDVDGKDFDKPTPAVRVLVRDDKTDEFLQDKADPVKVILEVDKDKKPVKEEPVMSAEFYDLKLKEVRDNIDMQDKKLKELVAEHKKLVEEIVGVNDDKGLKIKRGLQDDRKNQLDYLKQCLDEQKYLAPLVNNGSAELVILQKRHAALVKRLEELEKVAANR